VQTKRDDLQEEDAEGEQLTATTFRCVRCPAGFAEVTRGLRQPPLMDTPLSIAGRFADTWTEALEGCMAGDAMERVGTLPLQIIVGADPA